MSFLGLSQEEIEAASAIFSEYDADHSGVIDAWELKRALTRLGQAPSEDEVFALLSEADTTGDAKIDFGEFLRVISMHKTTHNQETLEDEIFEAYLSLGGTPDKKGFVDKQTVVETIRKFGLLIDVEGLFNEIDVDNNRKVDYAEFAQFLREATKS
eukprot:ANDGO_02803.mRNA.1 Dynein 18 kDa light chain